MQSADPSNRTETAIKLWTIRLYQEYDALLYQYRLSIRKALITVADLKNQWGTWTPLTRTITISRRLIELHPWDVVIEVLKHETAHQIAFELFKAEKPHGEEFSRACKILGLKGWAAQASGEIPDEIPHWKDRVMTEEEERLMRKVEKLLSLATSSNEHEALLAMQRVREIYAKYQLDCLRDNDRRQYEYLVINRKRKRIDAVESLIYAILVEHFFVKVIYSTTYDAEAFCEYKVAEILGSKENVLMAEYVFHFLLSRTKALWESYKDASDYTSVQIKNSYTLGVLTGFRTKLRQQSSDHQAAPASGFSQNETKSLMLLEANQLNSFVASRFPRLSNRSRSGSYVDKTTFSKGEADGRRITLNKGLSNHMGNRGLFLGK